MLWKPRSTGETSVTQEKAEFIAAGNNQLLRKKAQETQDTTLEHLDELAQHLSRNASAEDIRRVEQALEAYHQASSNLREIKGRDPEPTPLEEARAQYLEKKFVAKDTQEYIHDEQTKARKERISKADLQGNFRFRFALELQKHLQRTLSERENSAAENAQGVRDPELEVASPEYLAEDLADDLRFTSRMIDFNLVDLEGLTLSVEACRLVLQESDNFEDRIRRLFKRDPLILKSDETTYHLEQNPHRLRLLGNLQYTYLEGNAPNVALFVQEKKRLTNAVTADNQPKGLADALALCNVDLPILESLVRLQRTAQVNQAELDKKALESGTEEELPLLGYQGMLGETIEGGKEWMAALSLKTESGEENPLREQLNDLARKVEQRIGRLPHQPRLDPLILAMHLRLGMTRPSEYVHPEATQLAQERLTQVLTGRLETFHTIHKLLTDQDAELAQRYIVEEQVWMKKNIAHFEKTLRELCSFTEEEYTTVLALNPSQPSQARDLLFREFVGKGSTDTEVTQRLSTLATVMVELENRLETEEKKG